MQLKLSLTVIAIATSLFATLPVLAQANTTQTQQHNQSTKPKSPNQINRPQTNCSNTQQQQMSHNHSHTYHNCSTTKPVDRKHTTHQMH